MRDRAVRRRVGIARKICPWRRYTFWPVYVCRTKAEWEKEGRLQYAEQARLCCENTLYVNSLCRGDAIGGAVQFLDGKIKKELPAFHEGLLYVTV